MIIGNFETLPRAIIFNYWIMPFFFDFVFSVFKIIDLVVNPFETILDADFG